MTALHIVADLFLLLSFDNDDDDDVSPFPVVDSSNRVVDSPCCCCSLKNNHEFSSLSVINDESDIASLLPIPPLIALLLKHKSHPLVVVEIGDQIEDQSPVFDSTISSLIAPVVVVAVVTASDDNAIPQNFVVVCLFL